MAVEQRSEPVFSRLELRLPTASIEVLDLTLPEPVDTILHDEQCYRLDYTPTARLPRTEICFTKRWAAHRFAAAGKLFLVPPGEEVRVRADPGRLPLVVCSLASDGLGVMLGEPFEWRDRHRDASPDLAEPLLAHLLFQLDGEIRRPRFAGAFLVEGIVTQLAAVLARQLVAIADRESGEGLAGWRLRAIDEQLERDDHAPTLAELASVCRLSIRQLSRAFRASRGVTIGRYVADHRLDRAKRLLAEGRSVADVAKSVGFSSSSNFSFAFRRATAMAPREFRDRR